MEEELSKVDRLVSIDVAAKFEALQDEVDLLKNEIKQTLVDLREFLMKDRTIFPQLPMPSPNRASTAVVRQKKHPHIPVVTSLHGTQSVIQADRGNHEGLNIEMLSNFIAWLGSVKGMGLTLQQITPYLEAYESSGYLQPILLKVILRSMADLDQLTEADPNRIFSPEEYATCVGQLHRIICESDFLREEYMASPDSSEVDSALAAQVESGFGFDPESVADLELPGEGGFYSSPESADSSGNDESNGNEETDG